MNADGWLRWWMLLGAWRPPEEEGSVGPTGREAFPLLEASGGPGCEEKGLRIEQEALRAAQGRPPAAARLRLPPPLSPRRARPGAAPRGRARPPVPPPRPPPPPGRRHVGWCVWVSNPARGGGGRAPGPLLRSSRSPQVSPGPRVRAERRRGGRPGPFPSPQPRPSAQGGRGKGPPGPKASRRRERSGAGGGRRVPRGAGAAFCCLRWAVGSNSSAIMAGGGSGSAAAGAAGRSAALGGGSEAVRERREAAPAAAPGPAQREPCDGAVISFLNLI